MKTLVIAAFIMALLPVAAFSQEGKRPVTSRTDAQLADDAANERAYRNAIEGTRTKGEAAPAKVDPWQTVRPASPANPKR